MHFGKSQSQQRYVKKEQCQSQYVVETKSPQVSHLRPWFQVEHFTISFFLFFSHTQRNCAFWFEYGLSAECTVHYNTLQASDQGHTIHRSDFVGYHQIHRD